MLHNKTLVVSIIVAGLLVFGTAFIASASNSSLTPTAVSVQTDPADSVDSSASCRLENGQWSVYVWLWGYTHDPVSHIEGTVLGAGFTGFLNVPVSGTFDTNVLAGYSDPGQYRLSVWSQLRDSQGNTLDSKVVGHNINCEPPVRSYSIITSCTPLTNGSLFTGTGTVTTSIDEVYDIKVSISDTLILSDSGELMANVPQAWSAQYFMSSDQVSATADIAMMLSDGSHHQALQLSSCWAPPSVVYTVFLPMVTCQGVPPDPK
jgi:hypothetical protein